MSKYGVLHATHFASAGTDWTHWRLGATFHARAVTVIADLEAVDLHLFLRSKNRFFELEIDGRFKISPAHRPTLTSRRSTATKEGLKDVGERRSTTESKRIASTGTTVEPADARVTEPIVGRATIVIVQHFVGFVDLFELLFSAVVFVDVGVIFPCQSSVGTPDLVVRRGAGYPKYFVIVAFGAHEFTRR